MFDPIAAFQALDENGVMYIVIGALGRVIHGTAELTCGIDIVPSMKEQNLRRLRFALDDLHASRPDGEPLALEVDLVQQPLLELQTDAGELKIVREPPGTLGYNSLRRRANREPLGHGVRPYVASTVDHVCMLSALNREQDVVALRTLRRVMELEDNRLSNRARRPR